VDNSLGLVRHCGITVLLFDAAWPLIKAYAQNPQGNIEDLMLKMLQNGGELHPERVQRTH